MKYMTVIIIPFLISFTTLDKDFRGMTKKDAQEYLQALSNKDKANKIKLPRERAAHRKNTGSKLIREITKLKKIGKFRPTFGSEYGEIKTMGRVRGFVEGNIKASTRAVRFKVNIEDNGKFPFGSYLACIGSASAGKYNYRIISECDRLITDEGEYKVSVTLKDTNLTDGITADYVYTGLEEEILGSVFTTAASVMIDAQKDRVLTALGFATEPSAKNAMLSGISAGVSNANNTIKESNSDKYILLAVEDRKEVIIEFNRSFSYEK